MASRSRAAEDSGRTYRVVGPHHVHGTPPGGTFTKQLAPVQEEFLIRLGHIEIVGADEPDTDQGAVGADTEE